MPLAGVFNGMFAIIYIANVISSGRLQQIA